MKRLKWHLTILFCLLYILSFTTSVKERCINRSKPLYLLPFPPGASYYVLQGNCGKHSHFGNEQYAYDFRMPSGSVITAIRSGRVVHLREQFHDGSNTNDSLNFLIILHDDSTVSRYLHLTHNGVIPEKGDYVQAGDTIGYSGNTGKSTEPHLHIDITGYCTKAPCQTLPFSFINCTERVPLQGRTYTALQHP
ncbi:MAG: M23 family metallopeptidase [Chitinophagaceae bacterium]|nr:M23 family metallopeptidase [Chitinophagaceae bacterium]